MNTHDAKRQFLTCLRVIYRPPGMSVPRWRQEMDARELSLGRLHTLLDQLWGCWDRMPAWACRSLGLGKQSTYHDAVIRLSVSRLNDLSDTDFFKALVSLFEKDAQAHHPESPETPISPNTVVFVAWLRTYLPGDAEELIKQFFSTPPSDSSWQEKTER
jgi:hypothetical protein